MHIGLFVWWVQLLLNFKEFNGHRFVRAALSVISISIRYYAFELSMASVL